MSSSQLRTFSMQAYGKYPLVASLALIAGMTSAQETYTVKLAKPEQTGDRYRRVVDNKVTYSSVVRDGAGATVQDASETMHYVSIQTVEIIDKQPGKRPAKLKSSFEKAVKIEKNGEVDLGLKGKSLLVERKGGKYEFRFEAGGEIKGD